jgi:hypothetical protein
LGGVWVVVVGGGGGGFEVADGRGGQGCRGVDGRGGHRTRDLGAKQYVQADGLRGTAHRAWSCERRVTGCQSDLERAAGTVLS